MGHLIEMPHSLVYVCRFSLERHIVVSTSVVITTSRCVEVAAAVAAFALRTVHELDFVNENGHAVALLAVLLPLGPAKLALDCNTASLGEILGDLLGAGAEQGAIEVVGIVFPFASGVVATAIVDCNREVQNGGTVRVRVAKLGVAGEVSCYHYEIDRHDYRSFRYPMTGFLFLTTLCYFFFTRPIIFV